MEGCYHFLIIGLGPNLFTSNIQDVFGLESGLYVLLRLLMRMDVQAIDTIEIEEFSIDVGSIFYNIPI